MPKDVFIFGVRYVPVSDAHVDADKVIDALMRQWYGHRWQENYPEGPTQCRVVVSDGFSQDEGDSIADFAARVIEVVEEEQ